MEPAPLNAGDLQILGLAITLVVIAFGALFVSLRMLLNNGITAMKETIKAEMQNMDGHCKLVSGNLHGALADEAKQRVASDDRIESTFKNHGHKGLANGDSKVTI